MGFEVSQQWDMDLHGLVTNDNGLDDLISFVGFQYTFPNRKPELQKKSYEPKPGFHILNFVISVLIYFT